MRVLYDELPSAEGRDLGVSTPILVCQERIDMFADATEDRQWIHVDVDRAKQGPFGGSIAHGYLTPALVSPMLLELLEVPDASMAINCGLDRVRFPSPVRARAEVRGQGTVLAVTQVRGGYRVTTRVTVTAEEAPEKPACVADVRTRFLR